jgi:hypothetical protein
MAAAATSKENATTESIHSNNSPSQVMLQILLNVPDKRIGPRRPAHGLE